MKRSEMISIIERYLFDNDSTTADELLNIMEEAGIAPPYSDKIFQKNARIYIDATGREWEPE